MTKFTYQAWLAYVDSPAQAVHVIDKEEQWIGRGEDCQIRVLDRYVSRRQAKIYWKDDLLILEDYGHNPILVNGQPAKESILKDGDHLMVGSTEFVVQIISIPKPGELKEEAPEEEVVQTVMLKAPAPVTAEPRLVLEHPDGKSDTFPLKEPVLTIGRAPDCSMRLDDPAVSRKHCVLERKLGRWQIRNVSKTNPVTCKGKVVGEKELYSGDRFNVGPFSLTFLSDLPEDQSPKEIAEKATLWAALPYVVGMVAVVFLVAGIYLFYGRFYAPWQLGKESEQIYRNVDSADPANLHRETLKLLGKVPTTLPEKTGKVLGKTVIAVANREIKSGQTGEAKELLEKATSVSFSPKVLSELSDLLDRCRLVVARKKTSQGQFFEAFRELARIPEKSPSFSDAEDLFRQAWISYQRENLKHYTVNELLERAEKKLEEQHYVLPVNDNAYALYQAVLSLDKTNSQAFEGIKRVKERLLGDADRYFSGKKYNEALDYYQRYSLIDPKDSYVHRRVKMCKRHLLSPKKTVSRHASVKHASKQKKGVEKLLKETGTESSWIMKYLFEEEKKGKP